MEGNLLGGLSGVCLWLCLAEDVEGGSVVVAQNLTYRRVDLPVMENEGELSLLLR